MAAKKKSKKKQIRKRQTAAVTRKPVKKKTIKKPAKKKTPPKRKLVKKKTISKKAVVKTKTHGKKKAGAKIASATRNRASGINRDSDTSQDLRTRSAGQSGSLQGLSNVEGADSESVDELIEEGNAFEADVVAGVERADDTDEEVHTHEVPEDDVPGEYLDED
jgi:hypothetical protein